MKKAITFFKKEAVLIISLILAALSMLFIPFDKKYINYIDIRVLVLLFCLMATVGALKEQGIFAHLCSFLLSRAKNVRKAAVVLVLLAFFSSMLVTNDVALITFVPLAIGALYSQPRQLLLVVVMQTIAANLGSSLTPFGNPQNLYLSAFYNVPIDKFLLITAPIALSGLVFSVFFTVIKTDNKILNIEKGEESGNIFTPMLLLSCALFILCVASVLHIISYKFVFVLVCASLLIFKPRSFLHIDISLLLTFVFLFIFVGNMGRIPLVQNTLQGLINGRALIVSALASQLISNVPAALMLSGFTADSVGLITGVNIGGLGTPIASMASLISLRLYSQSKNADTKSYLIVFSIYNFLFLAVLLCAQTFLFS